MKKYVLIKSEEYFYDGHGEASLGESCVKVEHTDKYNDLDFSKIYDEDLYVLDEDFDEEMYAEDGYHCSNVELNFKEITEDEYNEYSKIISDYDKLLNI